jgi:heat shock protein HslJ
MTRSSIAGLAVLVSACAGAPQPAVTADQLVGSSWHVSGLNAGGVQDRKMTISFEPDRMVGNAACNDYGIAYTLQGRQLKFARTATLTTDRFCDPDTVETEERFLATLGEVRSASIAQSGSLVLTTGRTDMRIVARPLAGNVRVAAK